MDSGDYRMSYEEPLTEHTVAISISESSDMSVLGLSDEHLVDAMAEIARHLLAMGARLMYGGDLRPKGFTEVLFELVARYRRDASLGDDRLGVSDFLAWPVHISLTPEAVNRLSEELTGVGQVVYLTLDGDIMSTDQRQRLTPRIATDTEWVNGLTAMRNAMTKMSDARIVLGGKVENFKGRMPGIAEEAILALRSGQPLFVLGGFGGCARDISAHLGLVRTQVRTASWPGLSDFMEFRDRDLNNGLNYNENEILATSVHVDQLITLILRGLFRQTTN